MKKQLALIGLAVLIAGSSVLAQLITGTINGTVTDPSGTIIPQVQVTLINEGTKTVRTETSDESGLFTFVAVPPSTYTVRLEMKGFRTFERNKQVLQAGDHLSLGNVPLTLGDVSEKITVTAQGATVQTSSSETSHSLTETQISMIQAKARDPISLLRILPGVSLTGQINSDTLGNNFGTATPNFNGTRSGWNTTAIDGQTESNTFAQSTFNGMSSMDSIGEAKVVTTNYQAEYGRNSGVFVNFVSKSGTKDFHGNAYWYKRHEQFNANDFFNNRNGIAKPRYRYSNYGGTIGGPIYIPGKFNTNRDKLFFFFSGELWTIHYPAATTLLTMPTNLERAGNFSQTLDLNGVMIPIIDPTTHAPFPGNTIPTDRINRDGQSLFKIYPQPNILDRNITKGNYNYQYQRIFDQPKNTELAKVDYNISNKDRLTVRFRDYYSDQQGYGINIGPPWPLVRHHYAFPSHSINVNYSRTISPTLLNEASFGRRWGGESSRLTSPDEVDFLSRKAIGINIKQFHPENNPLNVLPQVLFGGVPSAPSFTLDDRFPLDQTDHMYEFRDNFTANRGGHLFKFGFLLEQNWTNKGIKGNGFGTFDFGKDTNNPFDANYAFANALLGNFKSYTEATTRNDAPVTHLLYEWFAQDTWKVNRRLTLDYGMRFSWGSPYRYVNGNAGAFILERYDPKKAPPLIRPALDPATGKRAGQNPVTGAFVSPVLIGSYVPGIGDSANGLTSSADKTYPNGFRNAAPMQFAPRFGFAYDVFGDGKTAVRGGFGITKEMTLSAHEMVWNNLTHGPVQYNPVVYYGDLTNFLNSANTLFPPTVQGLEKNPITPSVYSYNFNIQRNVGAGTVVSAGYVGNVGRHLEQARNINLVPYGARFLPQNADPANPAGFLGDDFFRPYSGLGGVTYVENSGTSNYNGLQVTVNRRFTKGVQFGVAYTWSKTMDLTDGDGGVIPTYQKAKSWLYGRAGFDQTHVFVLNYSWDLPRASTLWNNFAVRQALDNWQVSGVTTFASGFPTGLNYQTTDGQEITGGGDGGRVILTGKASKSYGDRTFQQFFNTSVVSRPPKGSFGNAPKDIFRGPGFNNWDISGFKNFRVLGSDVRLFQLRCELYNAFNHTQFAGVDTTARFDPTGKQVNGQFGQVTSTRTPRIMQLSISFKF